MGYRIEKISSKPIHSEKLFSVHLYENKIIVVYTDGFYLVIEPGNREAILFGNFSSEWSTSFLNAFVLIPAVEIIMRTLGYFSLHAGAVVRNGKAILVLGKSGSGKTTAIMRLALSGHPFMGDDTVLVDREANVYSFLKPVHLNPHSVKLLGLEGVIDIPAEGKGEYTVHELEGVIHPFTGTAEISRMFFVGQEQGVTKMSESDVFKELLGYSLIPLGQRAVSDQMKVLKKISGLPAVRISREELKDEFEIQQ